MTILRIDRSAPQYDLVAFLRKIWSNVEEHDRGWIIIEEEDERSLALTEVDLTKVRFETGLEHGENYITGEERLKRLKSHGCICLDAKVLQTLWENQHLIPTSWKGSTNRHYTWTGFCGTILRDWNGSRYVLCLHWGFGKWNLRVISLGLSRHRTNPFAVLAS